MEVTYRFRRARSSTAEQVPFKHLVGRSNRPELTEKVRFFSTPSAQGVPACQSHKQGSSIDKIVRFFGYSLVQTGDV